MIAQLGRRGLQYLKDLGRAGNFLLRTLIRVPISLKISPY